MLVCVCRYMCYYTHNLILLYFYAYGRLSSVTHPFAARRPVLILLRSVLMIIMICRFICTYTS